MISVYSINIKELESYEKILEYVPRLFVDDDVIEKLQSNLGTKCDEIRIEYPYYDSDYLSTYSIHYAQKLRGYERKCCRLHILKENEYYGYIILRPTVSGTKVGRTLLYPEILLKEKAYLPLYDFEAHVLGNTMEIQSFPWKSQETDISVCAHTATWTILRYFGNKFKNYADTTIGNIVQITDNDWGRKTPSIGLNPIQVSDILKKYGFAPLILQCKKEGDDKFRDEIMAYIESGIPMIGFLYPRKHAISIIGHGLLNTDILDDEIAVSNIIDNEIGVVQHSRLLNDFYVMDDNYFPYKRMRTSWADSKSDVDYGTPELKYCVVPLYHHEMELGYSEVYRRFTTWMKAKVMDWETPCVSRIYITTANSLKKEALKSENMNEELVEVILKLSLPKFVWCIDMANFDEYKNKLTSGRIIIDTTAPTLDEEPWLLMHDKKAIYYVDVDAENGYLAPMNHEVKEVEIAPYKLYINNLRECNVMKEDEKNE